MDDHPPLAYHALEQGAPVYSSDGERIGNVHQVLENTRENIFDGIVIDAGAHGPRFVDAPEVARITERGVRIDHTAAEVPDLPLPEDAAPSFRPNLKGSRLFGGGWRKTR